MLCRNARLVTTVLLAPQPQLQPLVQLDFILTKLEQLQMQCAIHVLLVIIVQPVPLLSATTYAVLDTIALKKALLQLCIVVLPVTTSTK
jgi:hypothetical protein